MTASDVVAIISVIISGFSLWYSRGALQIARGQEKRQSANFTTYFHMACCYENEEKAAKRYEITLDISNHSDSSNSILMIELQENYLIGDEAILPVKMQYAEVIEPDSAATGVSKSATPLYFAARETKRLQLGFNVPFAVVPKRAELRDKILVIHSGNRDTFAHQFEA